MPVRIGDVGAQTSSPIPNSASVPAGLANAAGMLASGLSAVSLDAAQAAPVLPESTFYRWSCGHFSRPLLEPSHDDEEEILARREERERVALDGIDKCQHSSEWLFVLVKNVHTQFKVMSTVL